MPATCPEYVQINEIKREKLFRKVAKLKGEEFSLLNALCAAWKPEIPFFPFLESLENGMKKHDILQKMLEKLKITGMGLLIYSPDENGDLAPDSIILTDQNSPYFFERYIRYHYFFYFFTQKPMFATLDLLEKELPKAKIPSWPETNFSIFFNYSPEEVENIEEMLHFSFPNETVTILVFGKELELVYRMALLSLCQAFGYGKGKLASSCNITENDFAPISDILAGKEIRGVGWAFLDNIEKKLDAILPQINSAGGQFTIALAIIKGYNVVREKILIKEKEKNDTFNQKLEDLADDIKAKGTIVPVRDVQKELNELSTLAKTPDKVFKEKFQTPSGKDLPPILRFEEGYIHQQNITPLFETSIRNLSERVKLFYYNKIEEDSSFISSGNLILFTSYDSLLEDIDRFIREEFTPLLSLLKHPEVVFKASLESMQQLSSEERQKSLQAFFTTEGNTIRFLSIPSFLSLDFVKYFEEIFQKKSISTKIFMKIFGQYKTVRSKMIGYNEIIEKGARL